MEKPSHFGLVFAKVNIPTNSKSPTTNINGVSLIRAKNVLAIPGITNFKAWGRITNTCILQRMHVFVILPQALKLVIPGIANTFLALIKDTPLIFVVGLLELVGMLNLAKLIQNG